MDSLNLFRDKIGNVLLQRGYEIAWPKSKALPYTDPMGDIIRVDIEGKDKYASIMFYSQGWVSIDAAEKDITGNINVSTVKTILYEPGEIKEKEVALLGLLDFLV